MYLTKTPTKPRISKINKISSVNSKKSTSTLNHQRKISNNNLTYLQQQSQNESKTNNTNNHERLNSYEIMLKEFQKNRDIFDKLFSDKKSKDYTYLEDIYMKYSKNLTKFFKNNKRGLQLTGSKKFENLPIDLFLSEIEVYKKNILQKIKDNTLTYSNPNDNLSKKIDEKIRLTPLPSKSRLLMKTNKEKNDFTSAERTAVYMRIVEYTHSLRTKEGKEQYEKLLREEKEKIIFIMKKSVDTIQNWWIKIKKKKSLENKEKEIFNSKYKKYLDILNNKKGNKLIEYITRYVKKKVRIKKKEFWIKLNNFSNTHQSQNKTRNNVYSTYDSVIIDRNQTFSIKQQYHFFAKNTKSFDSSNLKVISNNLDSVSFVNQSASTKYNSISIVKGDKLQFNINSNNESYRKTFNNKDKIRGRKESRFSIIVEPKVIRMKMQRVNSTIVPSIYENVNMKVFPSVVNDMCFIRKDIYIDRDEEMKKIKMIQRNIMIMEKEKKLLVLKKGHLLNHLLYLKEKNEIYNRKKRLVKQFYQWNTITKVNNEISEKYKLLALYIGRIINNKEKEEKLKGFESIIKEVDEKKQILKKNKNKGLRNIIIKRTEHANLNNKLALYLRQWYYIVNQKKKSIKEDKESQTIQNNCKTDYQINKIEQIEYQNKKKYEDKENQTKVDDISKIYEHKYCQTYPDIAKLITILEKIIKENRINTFNSLLLHTIINKNIPINSKENNDLLTLLNEGKNLKYLQTLLYLHTLNQKETNSHKAKLTFYDFINKLLKSDQKELDDTISVKSNNEMISDLIENDKYKSKKPNPKKIKITKRPKPQIPKDSQLTEPNNELINDLLFGTNSYQSPFKSRHNQKIYNTDQTKKFNIITLSSNKNELNTSQTVSNNSEFLFSEDIIKAHNLLRKKSRSTQKDYIMLRENNEEQDHY